MYNILAYPGYAIFTTLLHNITAHFPESPRVSRFSINQNFTARSQFFISGQDI